jgi:hypothetical protein
MCIFGFRDEEWDLDVLKTVLILYGLLFRANPHLTSRVHQVTSHVTPRRSIHPRFT